MQRKPRKRKIVKSIYDKVLTSELIRQIKAYIPDYHEYEIEDVLTATFETIQYLVEQGERVEVKGFGKFYLQKNKSKVMYDPNVKTLVQSPGRTKLVFEVSPDYKEKVKTNEKVYTDKAKQN